MKSLFLSSLILSTPVLALDVPPTPPVDRDPTRPETWWNVTSDIGNKFFRPISLVLPGVMVNGKSFLLSIKLDDHNITAQSGSRDKTKPVEKAFAYQGNIFLRSQDASREYWAEIANGEDGATIFEQISDDGTEIRYRAYLCSSTFTGCLPEDGLQKDVRDPSNIQLIFNRDTYSWSIEADTAVQTHALANLESVLSRVKIASKLIELN